MKHTIIIVMLFLGMSVSDMHAQPHAESFDQIAYPARLQQKFFPTSDAYLSFRHATDARLNLKIKAFLPQSIPVSQATDLNLYAIYRYHKQDVTTQSNRDQSPIKRLGWIYINHYQTPQGVLRIHWAFDMDLNIKGYEIVQCRIEHCHLLHDQSFMNFMQGHSMTQLKTYISLSADHLIKPLPYLELSAQALGLSLINSAILSIQSILVTWPKLFPKSRMN